MKTIYQLVQIKRYGKKTIIFETSKYAELTTYISEHQEDFINLNLQIQQANIIKNKI